jgi:hypothetical protein
VAAMETSANTTVTTSTFSAVAAPKVAAVEVAAP